MIVTFRDILRRAGARLSLTSTATSDADDLYPKLKDWTNERYERIYNSFPWNGALEQTTKQLTASITDYGLPRDIGKIWSIYDTTNGQKITWKDVQRHDRFWAEDLDTTGNVVTGDPRRAYPIGKYTVIASIGATAEKVDVVSTSSSDVSPKVVHITGLVSSVEISEDIVLTGTVAASSSNTYDALQKIRVSTGTNDESRDPIAGVITIDGNTSGTVFAKISPQEIAPIYQWIRVSPTPKSSGTQPTWRFQYTKRLQMLMNDNDIPILDIGVALIEGVVAEGLREDGQIQEAELAEQRFGGMVTELQYADTNFNVVEQFTPADTELIQTLDYGRVVGGPE